VCTYLACCNFWPSAYAPAAWLYTYCVCCNYNIHVYVRVIGTCDKRCWGVVVANSVPGKRSSEPSTSWCECMGVRMCNDHAVFRARSSETSFNKPSGESWAEANRFVYEAVFGVCLAQLRAKPLPKLLAQLCQRHPLILSFQSHCRIMDKFGR
jgi:hypothetical protein